MPEFAVRAEREVASGRGGPMEITRTQINVQDQFLSRVRRDRMHVTIELTTGRKIEGIVLGFDNFSLLVRGASDQLIYKHAISSLSVGEKLDSLESKAGETR
jgi:host factor-I protein